MPIMIDDIGNTVSSSIPIALYKMKVKEILKKGDKLIIVGFGVGYSWSACVLNWI
jgi:3-oxoacyl-[acyl-carrier-protein] synthase-3